MPAKKPSPEAQEPDKLKEIHVDRIVDNVIEVPIVGLTPLIPHKWSEKALRMMRDKQMSARGSTRPAREPKNAEEEAIASCYWLPDGSPGMPATAFKAAIVEAARYYSNKDLTMTLLRRVVFVEGEGQPDRLVRIDSPEDPILREDTPRNSGGVADLRYRYMFDPWSALLKVRFMPSVLPPDSVYNLVDAAGRGGIGDWRPGSPKSNTGSYGTFRIDDDRLAQITKEAEAA